MSDRVYLVLCKDNCFFEAMSKEQILTAIEQAVSTGEIKDVDTGFVTTIKELNSESGLSFWVGTQAEYNALEERSDTTLYIISDDTTFSDLQAELNKILKGTTTVAKAKYAEKAGNTDKVKNVDLSDDNVSAIGNYIFPKKKLLWEGSVEFDTTSSSTVITTFKSGVLNAGDVVEIHYYIPITDGDYIKQIMFKGTGIINNVEGMPVSLSTSLYGNGCQIVPMYTYENNTLSCWKASVDGVSTALQITTTKIYKIIE